MAKLGTEKKPIMVRVPNENRGIYVAEKCFAHGWHYSIEIAPNEPEDISDLERALNPNLKSSNVPLRVEKIGRNDPCHCGSGQKYKKCCGSGTLSA